MCMSGSIRVIAHGDSQVFEHQGLQDVMRGITEVHAKDAINKNWEDACLPQPNSLGNGECFGSKPPANASECSLSLLRSVSQGGGFEAALANRYPKVACFLYHWYMYV